MLILIFGIKAVNGSNWAGKIQLLHQYTMQHNTQINKEKAWVIEILTFNDRFYCFVIGDSGQFPWSALQ